MTGSACSTCWTQRRPQSASCAPVTVTISIPTRCFSLRQCGPSRSSAKRQEKYRTTRVRQRRRFLGARWSACAIDSSTATSTSTRRSSGAPSRVSCPNWHLQSRAPFRVEVAQRRPARRRQPYRIPRPAAGRSPTLRPHDRRATPPAVVTFLGTGNRGLSPISPKPPRQATRAARRRRRSWRFKRRRRGQAMSK